MPHAYDAIGKQTQFERRQPGSRDAAYVSEPRWVKGHLRSGLLQRVPQRTAEARVFYCDCDQIGTSLMMTDDVGDVVWEASYKAWGEARKVVERASKAAGITPRNQIQF